jgi:hypothetical protein
MAQNRPTVIYQVVDVFWLLAAEVESDLSCTDTSLSLWMTFDDKT